MEFIEDEDEIQENYNDYVPKKYTWEKQRHFRRSGIKVSISGNRISDIPHRIQSFSEKPIPVLKKRAFSKRPSISPFSATASPSGVFNMIDTFDREPDAFAKETFASAKTYKNFFNDKTGKRIPKIGAYAEAGIGKARAEVSVFEAEARGPNASAGAEASLTGVSAMAKAEIASASASAGPLGVKVGLGVDTGVSAGVDGVEVKFLGTGIKFGPTTSVSLVGSEVSCVLQ
ncbi:uncharacterized protein LOC134585512 [Pelobates fuscus]|uniref:uncharacterized protein LOC134585512 n=1 Tax=Pelobates fuscus TaxID=191477 RepID=UPI002FE46B64